jgi:CO/xanthine dehydrogenase Mo-binding subunit
MKFCFAMKSNINLLAQMAGLSPWDIRCRNAIRPGQVLPKGQIAEPNTALAETLGAAVENPVSHVSYSYATQVVILNQEGRVEGEKLSLVYGAKGVGELCLIPTNPAAAQAYYRLDGTFRSRLPIRPNYYRDLPCPVL